MDAHFSIHPFFAVNWSVNNRCMTLLCFKNDNITIIYISVFIQVQLVSERTIALRSKISKMVVVIVLLFTVCWGPIQLFILFQGFYPKFQANYETYKIKTWANCMSYANSCINPIVYGFMGASFRKSFKKVFPFMFRHKVRDDNVTYASGNAEMKFVTAET